ncbi:adenylyl cyclase X E-like isoform X2 [Drosophila kikkawai]|uniref:adenylate cyclase n=1 Tax=Drosophila kikkawai TaxID=30033 RepID=A0ABM4GQ61_DROKI
MTVHRLRKIHTIRQKRRKHGTCTLDYDDERLWESGYLRARCKELKLEEEYQKYQVRLMNSYLGVFYILHIAVTVIYVAQLLLLTDHTYRVYPDVATHILLVVLMLLVLSVNFFEDFVIRHRWVRVFTSVVASLLLLTADLGLNAYHYIVHDWPIISAMDIYSLCMIYMFLPIPSIRAAALLALFVSVLYVLYYFQVVYFLSKYASRSAHTYDLFMLDVFHYFGFNVMGIFFRMMNDTMVRSSFLDRHQFIMEENWLRDALHQEAKLLHNILPPQIAKTYMGSIKDKIMQADSDTEFGLRNYQSSMAVQIHSDVSILYADVVNYTHLTTTLSVEKLVMVLHDLYGRFDMAAAIYKVQRIKFLGDCYYCVAGLVEPDPDHAENAVSLGLSMISHIQEVRETRDLDIDMRIGIHSGSLFAGVIGQAKLQFDIWGADVDIANHLEATGKAGYVHISGRTLSNLTPSMYTILPGTEEAQNDPVLQKHPMNTYLITGTPSAIPSRRVTHYRWHQSAMDIKSRPNIESWSSYNSVTEELREEFDKMPVGGLGWYRRCCRYGEAPKNEMREIGLFCATFKDKTLEKNYLQQPDYIFKGSILMAWLIGVCMIYIQIIGNDDICRLCVAGHMVVFTLLTFLLFISWYKKVCWWRDGQNEYKKYSKFSCIIFHVYEKIQRSLFLRITCYFLTIGCYYSSLCMILVDCDKNKFDLEFIESKLYHYDISYTTCFSPWTFTNMMALILGMSYTFARIPFALKTCIGCMEAFVYLLILFFEYHFVFQHSNTTAPFLPSEVAHCDRILLMLVTLYMKERRIEFNAKTNYRLNVNLKNKQQAATATNQSIIILLNNILPARVAQHELYYENYRMISVMFAKLMNFKMDLPSLRVLNCIITEFDILLSRYKEYYMVEKIKVVGCTYMAACGLDFSMVSSVRKGRLTDLERDRSISREETLDSNDDTYDGVVYLMTTFALDLMRTLASCNRAYDSMPIDRSLSSTEIAIGISSGEIMAGVVGASQPHYDIWGNPVNMASRMQSTGLSGHIQVTEESAKILMDYGILCRPRGLTFVKGRGKIPTYFVELDENLSFVSTNPNMTLESLKFLSNFSGEEELNESDKGETKGSTRLNT